MKYQLFLSCCIFLLFFISTAYSQESASFDMQEISAFATPIGVLGQYAECNNTTPDKEVKKYPTFKSQKPIYGSITFDSNYTVPNSGIKYYFAIDESLGTDKGYDTFYFDINRDLDLTNDKSLNPMKNLPDNVLKSSGESKITYFDYLTINFDYGQEIGIKPFQIIPHLTVYTFGYSYLHFLSTTARKGEIHIGNYKYDAVIAQWYIISGRFDRPFTGIFLTPLEGAPPLGKWTGSEMLRSMHSIDGKFYSFSTTPTGDKLFVNPYKGDLGIFAMGPGNRKIKDMSVYGCIMSENTVVPIGKENPGGWPTKTKECRIPVGEYFPNYLQVEYGQLSMNIRQNQHSDGKANDRQDRPMAYGIKITKETPFYFDFPNQPEILFTSPEKDMKFKPGDTVSVETYLIDPKWDFVILNLKNNKRDLLPLVEIFNSSGKRIVTGAMRYG